MSKDANGKYKRRVHIRCKMCAFWIQQQNDVCENWKAYKQMHVSNP